MAFSSSLSSGLRAARTSDEESNPQETRLWGEFGGEVSLQTVFSSFRETKKIKISQRFGHTFSFKDFSFVVTTFSERLKTMKQHVWNKVLNKKCEITLNVFFMSLCTLPLLDNWDRLQPSTPPPQTSKGTKLV